MTDSINNTPNSIFEKRLELLKAELEKAGKATELDRAPVTLDQQSVGRLSRMDAMQMQAMAQAQQRHRDIELRRISSALSRMKDGEFGYCTHCGEPIAAKRLEVDPAASQCIKCAS